MKLTRHSVNRESDVLREVEMVNRWNYGSEKPDDYAYRSHGQPFTAYAAIAGCLFILIIANGASLWKEFNANAFLSAYLAVSL
jgi:yeast amino acid transporter